MINSVSFKNNTKIISTQNRQKNKNIQPGLEKQRSYREKKKKKKKKNKKKKIGCNVNQQKVN